MAIIEKDKLITINEAMRIADELGIVISRPTAIDWVKKHKLGHQPGKTKTSHWVVNQYLWEEFLKSD